MPIYEYRCRKCSHEFEELQSSNVKTMKCPKCGGTAGKKMSAAGFVFKGSGFYVNDYKNKSSESSSVPKTGGKDGTVEAAKPAENKTEKKTGSKPALKSKKDSAAKKQ